MHLDQARVVSDGVERMKTSLRSFGHYVPVDLVREVLLVELPGGEVDAHTERFVMGIFAGPRADLAAGR